VNAVDVALLVVSVLMFIYIGVALFKPEKF
jgi:K+-transporting ATPase KdpF subunit